jgi:hypothetical protein
LLASCSKCNQPALHLWQDVYDDTLHFWSGIEPIDEARIAATSTGAGAETIAAARDILRGKTVMSEHPATGDFSWGSGAAIFGLA